MHTKASISYSTCASTLRGGLPTRYTRLRHYHLLSLFNTRELEDNRHQDNGGPQFLDPWPHLHYPHMGLKPPSRFLMVDPRSLGSWEVWNRWEKWPLLGSPLVFPSHLSSELSLTPEGQMLGGAPLMGWGPVCTTSCLPSHNCPSPGGVNQSSLHTI